MTAPAKFKPCVICKGESCFVIPGIASSQCFCLMHFYTTGKHNDYGQQQAGPMKMKKKKNKKTSLLVDNERMSKQLPKVQDLFAEAFVELRAEVGEESARAFQKTKHYNADDPLASLLLTGDNGGASSVFKSMPSQVRKYNFPRKKKSFEQTSKNNNINDTEGGFIRETILPEKLRKLQNPNMNIHGTASNSKPVPTQYRREIETMNNPYRKRKKTSSVWHQILDSNAMSSKDNNSDDKKPTAKRNWDDMEKDMIKNITGNTGASSKTCISCNSTNIEIVGNSTSRNSDMTKGEVWGMKDRGEMVVERCRCLNCGRIWNED